MNELIPATMDDAAMWAIIVAFVSPLALDFLINANWNKWVKALAAFGFSAVVGTITAVVNDAYQGLGIPSMILLTAVVTIAFYQGFWKQVAPNLQRGSAKKAALEAEQKRTEIAAVAAPVAAAVAEQKVADMPVAEAYANPAAGPDGSVG